MKKKEHNCNLQYHVCSFCCGAFFAVALSFFLFLFYTFSLHFFVVLCCAFKVGWVHQAFYTVFLVLLKEPIQWSTVWNKFAEKGHAVFFFGTGFKSGKTNHTLKIEIWKLTVQLDKRCNCTFGFAFDELQTTMSLWCSWNERISYQPIPKCCAAGWPVLFGMVQHGSTTLSYAEWHRSHPSSPHPTSHTKDGEFFQAIHLSPKNGQKKRC